MEMWPAMERSEMMYGGFWHLFSKEPIRHLHDRLTHNTILVGDLPSRINEATKRIENATKRINDATKRINYATKRKKNSTFVAWDLLNEIEKLLYDQISESKKTALLNGFQATDDDLFQESERFRAALQNLEMAVFEELFDFS